ncbi:MAG: hypothetical protein ACSHW1_19260, partial [Yoonia sp.]|uniref:hypothetical protein n=1 Tax=Yoonia sp. TaxID=2212373 RepID=UPI003EF332D8
RGSRLRHAGLQSSKTQMYRKSVRQMYVPFYFLSRFDPFGGSSLRRRIAPLRLKIDNCCIRTIPRMINAAMHNVHG